MHSETAKVYLSSQGACALTASPRSTPTPTPSGNYAKMAASIFSQAAQAFILRELGQIEGVPHLFVLVLKHSSRGGGHYNFYALLENFET